MQGEKRKGSESGFSNNKIFKLFKHFCRWRLKKLFAHAQGIREARLSIDWRKIFFRKIFVILPCFLIKEQPSGNGVLLSSPFKLSIKIIQIQILEFYDLKQRTFYLVLQDDDGNTLFGIIEGKKKKDDLSGKRLENFKFLKSVFFLIPSFNFHWKKKNSCNFWAFPHW